MLRNIFQSNLSRHHHHSYKHVPTILSTPLLLWRSQLAVVRSPQDGSTNGDSPIEEASGTNWPPRRRRDGKKKKRWEQDGPAGLRDFRLDEREKFCHPQSTTWRLLQRKQRKERANKIGSVWELNHITQWGHHCTIVRETVTWLKNGSMGTTRWERGTGNNGWNPENVVPLVEEERCVLRAELTTTKSRSPENTIKRQILWRVWKITIEAVTNTETRKAVRG